MDGRMIFPDAGVGSGAAGGKGSLPLTSPPDVAGKGERA